MMALDQQEHSQCRPAIRVTGDSGDDIAGAQARRRAVGDNSGDQGALRVVLHCDYNTARPHRALGQLAPAQAGTRPPEINLAEHRIRRNQVLGGLTHEGQIAA
jgi:hypothetical protein